MSSRLRTPRRAHIGESDDLLSASGMRMRPWTSSAIPGLEHLPYAEVWFHEIDEARWREAPGRARELGKTGLEAWTTTARPRWSRSSSRAVRGGAPLRDLGARRGSRAGSRSAGVRPRHARRAAGSRGRALRARAGRAPGSAGTRRLEDQRGVVRVGAGANPPERTSSRSTESACSATATSSMRTSNGRTGSRRLRARRAAAASRARSSARRSVGEGERRAVASHRERGAARGMLP